MLGMGGRKRDIIQNWTIIFGIRQFMMLWSPGEQCDIALQELIFDNISFYYYLVGHGQSEGERAQISDFSFYVRDVFKHIDQVTADNTGIPIFMFGHSIVCTVIKTLLERCPLFFKFCFCFCCCLFVCFTFFKGIDGRFSGPVTALITEILVYVRIC